MGRVACIAFVTACIGEALSGVGPLSFAEAAGLPRFALDALLCAVAAANFVFALSPLSPTFADANLRDLAAGRATPTAAAARVEVLLGRAACVGITCALIGERLTGGAGPLAQVGLIEPAASAPPDGRLVLLWAGAVAATVALLRQAAKHPWGGGGR